MFRDWTLILVLVSISCVQSCQPRRNDSKPNSFQALSSSITVDISAKLSSSPLSPRSEMGMVAVGNQVVVWGGYNESFESNGAIFDLSSGLWNEIPKSVLNARAGHSMSSVATKVVIWGGNFNADGAIYDVATSQWTLLPPSNLGARTHHASAATGSKVVIWGGLLKSQYGSTRYADGAIYDVEASLWNELPTPPSKILCERFDHSMAAVGDKIIVWGGSYDSQPFGDGAIYDLTTSKWTKMPNPPAGILSPRAGASMTAVGDKIVIWGGSNDYYLSDGGIFDMSTSQWTAMPKAPLSPRYYHSMAAVGDRVLIWGGTFYQDGVSQYFKDGAVFDVSKMQWLP
ncbi:MAG: hypothetical protein NTV34_19805 [Proteobacteria bacterium]|nr:hypothetical protein [Pseudomonadota bacterium]